MAQTIPAGGIVGNHPYAIRLHQHLRPQLRHRTQHRPTQRDRHDKRLADRDEQDIEREGGEPLVQSDRLIIQVQPRRRSWLVPDRAGRPGAR